MLMKRLLCRLFVEFCFQVDECDFSMDTKMSGDHIKLVGYRLDFRKYERCLEVNDVRFFFFFIYNLSGVISALHYSIGKDNITPWIVYVWISCWGQQFLFNVKVEYKFCYWVNMRSLHQIAIACLWLRMKVRMDCNVKAEIYSLLWGGNPIELQFSILPYCYRNRTLP